MKRFALSAVAVLLAGCSDPLEIPYREKLAEAQAHCAKSGGDEFRPYGMGSWLTMFKLGRPSVFRCVRFGKVMNRNLAVYALKREGDAVVLEIR